MTCDHKCFLMCITAKLLSGVWTKLECERSRKLLLYRALDKETSKLGI